jgi:hypothetical protein
MKSNKTQNQLYGLIAIGIGIILVVLSGPLLLNIGAMALGLFLINYGLLLRGSPSLITIFQKIVHNVSKKFF